MRALRLSLFLVSCPSLLALMPALPVRAEPAAPATRRATERLVASVRRADYAGDRAALARLHDELAPLAGDPELATRVGYWQGFALWRRAVNGFNDGATPEEQQADLEAAVGDFEGVLARDPVFVEAHVGAASCLGNLMYLNMKTPDKAREYLEPATAHLEAARKVDPDNPRLLWVEGPRLWAYPPERGGGQDKAFDAYERGLASVRREKGAITDPLMPSWGEPELLMNRSWSNLNRTTPDLPAAERDARAALRRVPYWHYVRDILLPQIRAARKK